MPELNDIPECEFIHRCRQNIIKFSFLHYYSQVTLQHATENTAQKQTA